jgi:hypothetical protein
MRHVRIDHKAPDKVWLDKAATLLKDLEDAADEDARNTIIDKNGGVWRELKDWLLVLSHQKCWFSETKDGFNHWHVEHFRPKKSAKDLDSTVHDAYWWLAFDWKNFRICGNVGNTKKGTFFPLREGCERAKPGGDLRLEDPMLLDPTSSHDASLLSFNFEGDPIVSPTVTDDWEIRRVQYSIDRMNLKFGPLCDKRKTVWTTCWAVIEEYLSELSTYHADKDNAVARAGFKKAADNLLSMIDETQELSSVARACILSSADPRVIRVLQAA